MSNFWREIQNGLSDCKYWGISEKILRKEYFKCFEAKKVMIQTLPHCSVRVRKYPRPKFLMRSFFCCCNKMCMSCISHQASKFTIILLEKFSCFQVLKLNYFRRLLWNNPKGEKRSVYNQIELYS